MFTEAYEEIVGNSLYFAYVILIPNIFGSGPVKIVLTINKKRDIEST